MKQTLKQRYESLAIEYAKEFCKKQELDYSCNDWVGGAKGIGGFVCINDMYISYEDIRFDVDNEVPMGVIVDYYYYSIDNYDHENAGVPLNYEHFIIFNKQ